MAASQRRRAVQSLIVIRPTRSPTVRQQIAVLKKQETDLREILINATELDRVGDDWIAKVSEQKRRLLDREALENHFGADTLQPFMRERGNSAQAHGSTHAETAISRSGANCLAPGSRLINLEEAHAERTGALPGLKPNCRSEGGRACQGDRSR
jgi:hypothetical protein